MNTLLKLLCLAVLPVLLAGCQVDVTTAVLFDGGGSGNISVKTTVDESLYTKFAAQSPNPIEEFTDRITALNQGWTVKAGQPGTSEITISKAFAKPEELEESLGSIAKTLEPMGVTIVPHITYIPSDDGTQFSVQATHSLAVNDAFAKANGFASESDLIAHVGTSVTSKLVLGSTSELVSASDLGVQTVHGAPASGAPGGGASSSPVPSPGTASPGAPAGGASPAAPGGASPAAPGTASPGAPGGASPAAPSATPAVSGESVKGTLTTPEGTYNTVTTSVAPGMSTKVTAAFVHEAASISWWIILFSIIVVIILGVWMRGVLARAAYLREQRAGQLGSQ